MQAHCAWGALPLGQVLRQLQPPLMAAPEVVAAEDGLLVPAGGERLLDDGALPPHQPGVHAHVAPAAGCGEFGEQAGLPVMVPDNSPITHWPAFSVGVEVATAAVPRPLTQKRTAALPCHRLLMC